MVAFLEKSTRSAGFHQIIDFITRSHICYALTKKLEVCVSFIKQFWRSAEALTDGNREVKINATIDGHSLSITEGSLRRHLKLADQYRITSLPNSEIFEQLALMGYHTYSDNPKKTAWEQFSSNIAATVICLATNRKFNFSRMIFEHMVSNISSPHKFLMYPRFIQICLDMQKHHLQQHTRIYRVPSLSMKVFSNMKRSTKGFSGQEVGLFPNMLAVTTPSPSPSRITSSPSPSPSPLPSPLPTPAHTPTPTQLSPTQPSPTQLSPTQHSPTQPSPTQPSPTQPRTEQHLPTPYDSHLHDVHSHGSDEGSVKLKELMNLITTLSDRIGILEADLMKTNKTYSSAYTKLILRVKKLESQIKIGKARKQARVVLSDDEAFEDDSSKQGRKLSDEEVQEKASTDTELFIQEVTPTEVIQDQEGSGKASDEVSTARAKKGTASEEVPIVSTAEVNLSTAGGTVTYSRRSAEKRSRQDKGKAILIEEEPKKKSKKELEQERLSYAKSINMKEQMNENKDNQIARDEEIARQWDEEERKRAMDEAKSTKKIDWNDPSVQIFETVLDFNQEYDPIDAEHGSEKQESPAKESLLKSCRKSTRKRQKLEEDAEKDELKGFLDIVPREEAPIEVESISTKFPIVDLDDMFFDKDLSCTIKLDVEELFRLVKERYSTSRPEGFDLMLWGDLHTLFEPDEDDEIWRDQHEYNLLSWRLCDFCGIHILLMENGLAIHMLTEKKYPLSQEMLTKMLSKKLEVDHESSQAFELLRFIRSQVQK
ncbi:hypothetical protein Tco_0127953 [Tanacetum coccineum]